MSLADRITALEAKISRGGLLKMIRSAAAAPMHYCAGGQSGFGKTGVAAPSLSAG